MQLALFDASPKADDTYEEPASGVFRRPAPLARADLDERVHEYTEAAHADNTRRAYRTDWAAFERWCAEQGEVAMPASSSTVEAIQRHGRWQHRRSVERYFRLEALGEGDNPVRGLV